MSIKNIPFNRAVAAGNYSRVKVLKKQSISCLSALCVVSMALSSGEVAARDLVFIDVSSGYTDCSYTETDTVATFNLTIHYKDIAGRIEGVRLITRGILLYTYNESGMLQALGAIANTMSINGYSFVGTSKGYNYTLYYGHNNQLSSWNNDAAFAATVRFTMLKSKIASWPAVGVRAGNYTLRNDVGDISGLAYIGPSTKGGNCSVVVDPEFPHPPPAEIPKVTMTAPDWDLGELPRGKVTISDLSEAKDQLCFSYEGSTALTDQKYLINATNSNGLSANGRYLLKSLEDSSQTVPYTLTLDSSKSSVLLPNTQNRVFSLETGGKTCFKPTFKAEPDKAVKGGAYSDILTFTVVAKP